MLPFPKLGTRAYINPMPVFANKQSGGWLEGGRSWEAEVRWRCACETCFAVSLLKVQPDIPHPSL